MTTKTATSIDLSLDRISRLVTHFPPYTRPTIHITGTNGKGSVTSIVASILRESGMKVGKFNSPHLVHPRDSIEIGGKPVEEGRYNEMRNRIECINRDNSKSLNGEEGEIGASPFEVLTVTALQIFEEEQVDMAVIEVGMGGRLDATNILPKEAGIVRVSAMTMVDLDHTRWLGSTISAIAREKAGIARPGVPFVLGPQPSESEAEVKRVVRECVEDSKTTMRRGARVTSLLNAGGPYPVTALPPAPNKVLYSATINQAGSEMHQHLLDLPLRGEHQIENLSTSLGIIECLQDQIRQGTYNPARQITPEAIISGVAQTKWPGRLEFIQYTPPRTGRSYNILLDGAHNRSSAAALRAYLDSILPSPLTSSLTGHERRRISFVLALSDSPPKAPLDTLTPLLRAGDRVAITAFSGVEEMPWVRPVAPRDVQEVAKSLVSKTGEIWEGKEADNSNSGPNVGTLGDALLWAVGDPDTDLVVVAGSLYLVADFYRLMETRPQEFKRL
jgi:folylpolyglutamate synthase